MSDRAFVDALAAFGGQPRSPRFLHVGRPNVGDRELVLARVGAALDRRWLSNDGPMVVEFEELVADRLGVGHCVAVCNGTMALAVAAAAAGLAGEVIVPAFTFVATAHALAWHGIRPVFCDITPDSHHIDPERIDAIVTTETSAILAAHTWGRPCDLTALDDAAARNGLPLLFDAAPAFGVTAGGTFVGNFGVAEVLSFHATKVVNAGEGGAILTNDADLAERARTLRSFGFIDNDTVVALGTNAKMSELAAAMGISSIESYEQFQAVNERNFVRYRDALSAVPGIRVLPFDSAEQNNFHYVVVEIDVLQTGIDRDLVLAVLTAERVLARRYFYPGCHRMEPYRSWRTPKPDDFPVTDAVAVRVLTLPTGTDISVTDADMVCELLVGVVEHGEEISDRAARDDLRPPASAAT